MIRLFPFSLHKVIGHSMLPQYKPGSVVLAWHWFLRLKPGQVAIVRTSSRPLLKRVKQAGKEGVWVEGDNTEHSHDSRELGFIKRRNIEAIVVKTLSVPPPQQ